MRRVFVVVATLFLVVTRFLSASAQVPYLPTQFIPDCKQQGLNDGFSSGTGDDAECWADKNGLNALKGCNPDRYSCCQDWSRNTKCVRASATGGFQPASPDALPPLQPTTKGPVPKTRVTDTGGGPTAQPTPGFIPNVPIPGLFEATDENGIPINSSLFAKYVSAFFIYFMGVVGILAVVVMMWGGYHYIIAAGNPQRMQQGKETINGAIIGLVLSLISFLLLRLINPALVTFHGLFPAYIAEKLQPSERITSPEKPPGSLDCVSVTSQAATAERVKKNGYDQMIKNVSGGDTEFSYWLLSLLFCESSGIPTAVSKDENGDPLAYGLIQLLPRTAQSYLPADTKLPEALLEPETNIKAAAGYFRSLVNNPCPAYTKDVLKRGITCPKNNACKQDDITYAIAAYNAGRGGNFCSRTCPGETWWQCTGNPRYQQTRSYVYGVQSVYRWLKDPSNRYKFF